MTNKNIIIDNLNSKSVNVDVDKSNLNDDMPTINTIINFFNSNQEIIDTFNELTKDFFKFR